MEGYLGEWIRAYTREGGQSCTAGGPGTVGPPLRRLRIATPVNAVPDLHPCACLRLASCCPSPLLLFTRRLSLSVYAASGLLA
jgi:hypothetical protein